MFAQNKLNYWLFIILCLLVLGIYYLEYQSKTKHLTSLTADQVRQIKIETDDKATIIITRNNNHWSLNSPGNELVNTDKIQQILLLLKTTSIKKFHAVQTELHKYELISPRVNVYFNEHKISFGGLEPIDNLRYILIDDTVHLIKDEFYRHLLTIHDAFISQ